MSCKTENLWDIDLKFADLIFDVNIDNPEKFCKAQTLHFQKSGYMIIFGLHWLNLQTKCVTS